MEHATPLSFFWFRRDLRLDDNHGLFQALNSGHPVQPVFIFDREILDELQDRTDRRVEFIHQQIVQLQEQLTALGSTLLVAYGKPQEVWENWANEYNLARVYTNHDYEPYPKVRDEAIRQFLNGRGIGFFTFKDQVIFEKEEIMTGGGTPYTVFTPYSRKWKETLQEKDLQSFDCAALYPNFYRREAASIPSLELMNFQATQPDFPDKTVPAQLIADYAAQRDFPAVRGTSRLSLHLRFGTVSIRALVRKAQPLSITWLNELIWREFYQMILWNFPHVVGNAFRSKYDAVPWRVDEEDFRKWCEGRTGYPLVDAGMRELNATGFMHNRVRMVTASFLTKHLLIDWRWGEAYFAEKLLDFELASNNGGWQWAAGTGCDAAPYFRIFNPESQMKKFDQKGQYVRKWVPEFGTPAYPRPMVEHKFARDRCLNAFKEALAEVP